MRKTQLALLFFCSLIPWIVGNGVLPLLPVYAGQLGASSMVTGFYLAFCYLAIAIGALSGGWISSRLGRRKAPLIVVQIVSAPVMYLMGRARGMGSLAILTAILWLTGGLALALINIIAGMTAEKEKRGQVFGILSLANAVGLIVGGLGAGPIVDRWGFPALFYVGAGLIALPPIVAIGIQDAPQPAPEVKEQISGEGQRLGPGVMLILASGLIGSTGGFVGVLGRSLLMDQLAFAATAISSVNAVGGLTSLPLSPLAGWLSDRLDRRRLLVIGSVIGLGSAFTLIFADALWHFWLAMALGSVSMAVSTAVTPALVIDLVPRSELERAMSLNSSISWFGGILGFAGTGLLIQSFGLRPALAVGAGLSVTATSLIVALQWVKTGTPTLADA